MNGTTHVFDGERSYDAIYEFVNKCVLFRSLHHLMYLPRTAGAYFAAKAAAKAEKGLAKAAAKAAKTAEKEKVRKLCLVL